MPAKRRKRNHKNDGIILDAIKSEPVDDEIIIKLEPPENDYDMASPPQTKTIVYDQNGIDEASIDTEFGLVSQLDIIKSEIDVDETTLREFREDILSNKMNLPKVERTSNQMPIEQPIVLLHRLDESVISVINENHSIKLNPVLSFKKPKQIIKCPHCDFQTTTRNRSFLMKDHMYIHTGETPYSCQFCPQKFRLGSTLRHHVLSRHPDKRIYKCKLCGINMYNVDVFEAHKLKCVKVRTFECHLCKFKLKSVQMHKIKLHMRRAHTGEQVIKCVYCSEKFVSGTNLSSHMQRKHPNVMKLFCTFCNKRFKEDDKFNHHIQLCKTRQRFECHICGYSYVKLSLKGLRMHMRKHTGAKPFKCRYCSKYFPRSEALVQHLLRHREKYTLKCKQCHRNCLNENDLEIHEQNCRRRRYECHMCGFTRFGISFSKFRRHVLNQHFGIAERRCIGCDKSTACNHVLGKHVRIQHPHLMSRLCLVCFKTFDCKSDANAHQENCTKKRFECYLCYFSMSHLKTLINHMIVSHTSKRRFQCKQCSRKFQIKRNLEIHMKSHVKKDWIKCSYCNKKFFDIKYAKKHEFQCKRVYECYLCKKTFPSFTELYGRHFKSHLGEKPYVCKHCGKTIGSVRCYKLHVINYHLKSYDFKCNVCHGSIHERKHFRIHQKSCMKPIRQSTDVIYFTCSLCGIGLKRLPELRRHIQFNECKKHPQLKGKN